MYAPAYDCYPQKVPSAQILSAFQHATFLAINSSGYTVPVVNYYPNCNGCLQASTRDVLLRRVTPDCMIWYISVKTWLQFLVPCRRLSNSDVWLKFRSRSSSDIRSDIVMPCDSYLDSSKYGMDSAMIQPIPIALAYLRRQRRSFVTPSSKQVQISE